MKIQKHRGIIYSTLTVSEKNSTKMKFDRIFFTMSSLSNFQPIICTEVVKHLSYPWKNLSGCRKSNSNHGTAEDILNIPTQGDIGYAFEVDMIYPKKYHKVVVKKEKSNKCNNFLLKFR